MTAPVLQSVSPDPDGNHIAFGEAIAADEA